MPVTIRRLSPQAGVTAQMSDALARTAAEALVALSDDATVSFSIWDDGEGVRYVCKVETPTGDPLGDRPPWSFWSGLFQTPAELRAELTTRLAHRLPARHLDGAALPLAASRATEGAAVSPAP